MLLWLNGRVLDARRARVSALDRGLLHGDGVYDTWRTYGGRPFALAAHLRRLARGTRRLGLPAPGAFAAWEARTRLLLRRNGLADGAARLTITRGAAGSGPLPSGGDRPTLLLTVRPLPPGLAALQACGVAATLLPFPRDAGRGWGALKLVGHPSAVLGKQVAVRRRAFEGLYVTPDDLVTEGTTTNLFVVVRGTLMTPPADGSILCGVTRDLVLRIARRTGLRVREAPLPVARLRRADEVFVTASTIELVPVVRIDRVAVGGGRPGPMTRALQAGYQAAVARTVRLQDRDARARVTGHTASGHAS
jgi:branched-subunit amino acid aminotransferase/4-amino-4-deoxychorismate lyase